MLGVVLVVGDFLDGLGGEPGQWAVGGGEPPVQEPLVGGEVELAGDGVGEVAVGLFDELAVAEGAFLTEVGEFVLVADEGEQDAGLAEEVECDVGEGDFFFEDGGAAGPLPQALGEDEGVVAEGECRGRDGGGLAGHRCFTPSGIS
ncbi:hypothetical protein GCM10017752_35200 [Streptomyces roseoviridis]